MKITSFREFQRNLDSTIDGVIADRQPAVITRYGKPSVVLMALDDFAAFERFVGTPGDDHDQGREARFAALRETLDASIAAGGEATDVDLDEDLAAKAIELKARGVGA